MRTYPMSNFDQIDYKKTVLVVDDFATMRRIIVARLREIGFSNVITAEDGKQALVQANNLGAGELTFIVTDWNMPEMDGLELLKNIRSSRTLSRIPVMMVTAEAKRENIIEAAKSGANAYIVKPFSPETFAEKVEKIRTKIDAENELALKNNCVLF